METDLGQPEQAIAEAGATFSWDRYVIVDILGCGASGKVWRVADLLLNRVLAMKVFPYDSDSTTDPAHAGEMLEKLAPYVEAFAPIIDWEIVQGPLPEAMRYELLGCDGNGNDDDDGDEDSEVDYMDGDSRGEWWVYTTRILDGTLKEFSAAIAPTLSPIDVASVVAEFLYGYAVAQTKLGFAQDDLWNNVLYERVDFTRVYPIGGHAVAVHAPFRLTAIDPDDATFEGGAGDGRPQSSWRRMQSGSWESSRHWRRAARRSKR